MNTTASCLLTMAPDVYSTKVTKNILIVDDEYDHRLLLSDLLESRGFSPITAESGSEALEKLSTQRVNLVITDLMMPEMNGLELIRQMAMRTGLERTPVILVTGTPRESLEELAKSAGAFATVLKPYNVNRLITLITSALAQAESPSSNR